MEKKIKKLKEEKISQEEKLSWVAPKLYNLKLDKTFGGRSQGHSEDDSYTPGPSQFAHLNRLYYSVYI